MTANAAATSTGPVRERVCAVLLYDGRLALIRRQRPAGLQHSLPGTLAPVGE